MWRLLPLCWTGGRSRERGASARRRLLLHELERVSPGRSVEIRVVPVAAVQAVAGPAPHARDAA